MRYTRPKEVPFGRDGFPPDEGLDLVLREEDFRADLDRRDLAFLGQLIDRVPAQPQPHLYFPGREERWRRFRLRHGGLFAGKAD